MAQPLDGSSLLGSAVRASFRTRRGHADRAGVTWTPASDVPLVLDVPLALDVPCPVAQAMEVDDATVSKMAFDLGRERRNGSLTRDALAPAATTVPALYEVERSGQRTGSESHADHLGQRIHDRATEARATFAPRPSCTARARGVGAQSLRARILGPSKMSACYE